MGGTLLSGVLAQGHFELFITIPFEGTSFLFRAALREHFEELRVERHFPCVTLFRIFVYMALRNFFF